MKFLLVLIFTVFEGDVQPVVQTIEFDSELACVIASRDIVREYKSTYKNVEVPYTKPAVSLTTVCVEK